jgi:hypothetical protein
VAGAALGAIACKQILGVEDLGVVGSDAGDAGETGAGEAGGGGAGAACQKLDGTENCYTCCALLDGGDQGFFRGTLNTCVCGAECSADCPQYCPNGTGDIPDCDLCVFLASLVPTQPTVCADAAAQAAASSPGAAAIYECLQGCPQPTDVDCARLTTLQGCYDCCEYRHVTSRNALFGPGHDCVCDAGGCANRCSQNYCPSMGVDTGDCTRCALDALLDGGCASLGTNLCNSADCRQMVTCMHGCMQSQ